MRRRGSSMSKHTPQNRYRADQNGPAEAMCIEHIRVESIVITERLRRLSDETVGELADSIKRIGLVNPITIRRPNGGMFPHLVAGAHRLAAAKRLGWEVITCA